MNTFTTAYLLAVLFGVSTLVGFALERFNQHAVALPEDIVRLGLLPRLMTQPERYRVGLAVYIGITIFVYLLLTLFPEAVLALLSGAQHNVTGIGGPSADDLAEHARQASFPLAVAALMTSAQFLRFVAEPERFLRRHTQRLAGVPEDMGYVMDLIRGTDWLTLAELRDAAARLQVGLPGTDAEWAVYNRMAGEGRLELAPRVPLHPHAACAPWQPHAARAIQFADLLQRIRFGQQGVHPEPGERVDFWRHFDFSLFGNFWTLAEERIDRLHAVLEQIARPQPNRAPLTGRSTDAQWGREFERIQTELAAILAAGVSTGGTANFEDLVGVLHVFRHSKDCVSEPRRWLVDLRTEGVETRSEVVKMIFAFCFLLGIAGIAWVLLVGNPWVAGKVDGISRIAMNWSLDASYEPAFLQSGVDRAELCEKRCTLNLDQIDQIDQFCVPSPKASQVVGSGGGFMLLVAMGLACAIGYHAAIRRRNEFLAKTTVIRSRRQSIRPPRRGGQVLLSIERYQVMLRITLSAGLVGALLQVYRFVLERLAMTSETLTAAEELVKHCNSNVNAGMAELALSGADTFVMLGILAALVSVLLGALVPAVVVTSSIALVEVWCPPVLDGGTEPRCSDGASVQQPAVLDGGTARASNASRWGYLIFFFVLVGSVSFLTSQGVNLLAKHATESGKEQLVVVRKSFVATTPTHAPTGAADPDVPRLADDAGTRAAPGSSRSAKKGVGIDSSDSGRQKREGTESPGREAPLPEYAKVRYEWLSDKNFAPDQRMCALLRSNLGTSDAVRPIKFVEFEKTLFEEKQRPREKLAEERRTKQTLPAEEKPVGKLPAGEKPASLVAGEGSATALPVASSSARRDQGQAAVDAAGFVYSVWGGIEATVVNLVLFFVMFRGTLNVRRRIERRCAPSATA